MAKTPTVFGRISVRIPDSIELTHFTFFDRNEYDAAHIDLLSLENRKMLTVTDALWGYQVSTWANVLEHLTTFGDASMRVQAQKLLDEGRG